NGNYPANALDKKPQVQGASTSNPAPTTPVVTTPTNTTSNFASIEAEYDGDEAKVRIRYTNGSSETLYIGGDSKIEVVEALASQLGRTKAQILKVIEFTSGDRDDDDFNIDLEIDDDEVTLKFEYDGDDYKVKSDST